MVFRASYGEGFRAPTLDILTQQPQPGNPSVIDQPSCAAFGLVPCPNEGVQVSALTIANPEISSESSKQLSLGLAYQPTDWLNFSADYYDIEISNLIRFFGVGTILQRNQTGQPLPPGIGLTRFPNGGIELVTQGYSNEGKWAISGLDFNVNTNFDFGEFGRLNQTLQLSHRLSSEIDGGRNEVSDPGQPRQRGSFNNTYTWENLDFAWNVNFFGSKYAVVVVDADENVFRAGHFGSWVTHDVQVSYTLPTNTKISIGANNVFEKAPQLGTDPTFTRGYNFDLYDAYGRVMYFRISQSF
jgi:iron complex outermembrane receptor protein